MGRGAGKESLRRLGLVALASAYPLVAALPFYSAVTSASWVKIITEFPPLQVLAVVIGSRQLPGLLVVLLGSAFFIARMSGSWRGRAVAVAVGGVLAIYINPWLTDIVAKRVMSSPNYWRVFWCAPLIPILGSGLVAGAEVATRGFRNGRIRGGVYVGLIAVAVVAGIGIYPVWSRANQTVVMSSPGLKVDPLGWIVAEELVRATPAGMRALAPEAVASWVATMQERPALVFVRYHYTFALEPAIGAGEVGLRNMVGVIVSHGGTSMDTEVLKDAVARLRIGAVVTGPAVEAPVRETLAGLGFTSREIGVYTLWQIGGPATQKELTPR